MDTRVTFTHIIISVSYTGTENVIINKLVVFRVQQEEQQYIATPLINQEERILTNLPQEMFFTLNNQTLTYSRRNNEGNTDVLKDILLAIKTKHSLI